jgi:L,D-peptidoglycan transpeptidase YkuD (ErfK/YbiS/YcfS/YnhG family)
MLTRRTVLGVAAIGIAQARAGTPASAIIVTPPPFPTLIFGDLKSPCIVGRTGVRQDKHEGDGATPAGRYPLRRLLFRQDRISSIASHLPVGPIRAADGWSDDPDDPNYNQHVTLPYPHHHEELWRSDHLYDIVIVIGYNDAPVTPGKGSAIFLHVASPGMSATDGCIAVPLPAIVQLAGLCDETTFIDIRS